MLGGVLAIDGVVEGGVLGGGVDTVVTCVVLGRVVAIVGVVEGGVLGGRVDVVVT